MHPLQDNDITDIFSYLGKVQEVQPLAIAIFVSIIIVGFLIVFYLFFRSFQKATSEQIKALTQQNIDLYKEMNERIKDSETRLENERTRLEQERVARDNEREQERIDRKTEREKRELERNELLDKVRNYEIVQDRMRAEQDRILLDISDIKVDLEKERIARRKSDEERSILASDNGRLTLELDKTLKDLNKTSLNLDKTKEDLGEAVNRYKLQVAQTEQFKKENKNLKDAMGHMSRKIEDMDKNHQKQIDLLQTEINELKLKLNEYKVEKVVEDVNHSTEAE